MEDRPGHSNHNMLGPRVKINPNLVVVVDEDSQHIQEEVPQCMLFTDEMALVYKIKKRVKC